MNCSNSTARAKPSLAHPTRSFTVILTDGTRHRVSDRDLATQLRQERTAELKRLRQTRAEALAKVADAIEDARVRREFKAAEREFDAAIRRLSKRVRIRPERQRRQPAQRRPSSISRSASHAGLVMQQPSQGKSALARRDSKGREGMMLRIRYVRAGGKHGARGCLRRHWRYIAREAAVTLDSSGQPIVLSNLGETTEEVGDALALQEQVLRAMRKNAKLGFRMVLAIPYGLPVDARREVLQRIGDQVFGARGLPWSGAAHDADPEAAVDNPHIHFDYGLLPMERQADGSFLISNDLRTDLDGEAGLLFIRHMVAHVLTEVAQERGLDRTFTALSYRERGMDREGGEHVGQEATAAHRRGEHVAVVARNEARRRRDDAREKVQEVRKRLNVLEQLKTALERAARSVPSLPGAPSLAAEAIPASAPTPADAPALTAVAVSAPLPVSVAPDLARLDMPVSAGYDIDQPPADITQLPASALPVPWMPTLTDLPHVARLGDSPPTLTGIGAKAPAMLEPPEVARNGSAAPLYSTGPVLVDIAVAAPQVVKPPVVTVEPKTPAMPDGPSLVGVGQAVPMCVPAPSLAGISTAAPERVTPPHLAAIGKAAPTQIPLPAGILALGQSAPSIAYENFDLWGSFNADGAHSDTEGEEEQAQAMKARQSALARASEEEQRHITLQRMMAGIVAELPVINRRDVDAALRAIQTLVPGDAANEHGSAGLEQTASHSVTDDEGFKNVGEDKLAPQSPSDARPPSPIGTSSQESVVHRLATWLEAAQRADRISALEDDAWPWPWRMRKTQERAAVRQADIQRSIGPSVKPREPRA
ncbi:MAG: hypothetical protein KGJ57_00060 [Sphingomonadales bacterium]|nr:hypothetical protein [Sphingomonadales bacterium]MDE2167801.1 hypothetical protein [Sphingomonadales bacterium]